MCMNLMGDHMQDDGSVLPYVHGFHGVCVCILEELSCGIWGGSVEF